MPLSTFAIVSLVLFLSALARSSLGFGDALIAMPLLALVTDIYTATAVVALSATSTAIIILWGNWHLLRLQSAKRFFIAGTIGIACGLWILKNVPQGLLKTMLGIILIAYGLYNLLRPQLFTIESDNWEYCFGFIAGILGGACNAKGPPIVIFGMMRRWPPREFRIALQAYSFPLGVFVLLAHGYGGLWTVPVLELYIVALPVIVLCESTAS
jgi:uncharacterized membrane protein YfcA